MAVPKELKANKFDRDAENLDLQKEFESGKAKNAVKGVAGKGARTKTVVDKNGRTREIKVVEKRKTLPVYIPETLYMEFDEITTFSGVSKSGVICEMIRDYVTNKRNVLE